MKQNYINHVVFVLDASGSMLYLRDDVIRIFDQQVAYLARRSEELDQETRVTVYTFNSDVRCVIYDKDVLRLPSIKNLYDCRGNTALIDATYQSQEELARTAQLYGDHAFLTYVLTDGQENASRLHVSSPFVNAGKGGKLARLIADQADNWTMACLVPNTFSKKEAVTFGFPKDNVMVWDATTDGLEEASSRVTQATDTYMTQRASGVRGSKTLFAGSAQQVNQATVQAAGLTALDPDNFFLFPAVPTSDMAVHIPRKTILKSRPEGTKHVEIKEMIESTGRTYVLGNAYYELVKSEKVDANKMVAVVERATSKVYVGRAARQLIGLDDTARRVRPMPKDSSGHPPFKIFIQSQSTNRLLPIGSQVLLLK